LNNNFQKINLWILILFLIVNLIMSIIRFKYLKTS